MNVEIDFDYEKLRAVLLDEARTAFSAIQFEHPDKTFYLFILSPGTEHGGLSYLASTEEALTRHAEKKLADDAASERREYAGFTLQDLRIYYRYIGYYPDLFARDEMFREVNKLANVWHELIWRDLWNKELKGEISENEWEQISDFHSDKFDGVCLETLRDLDAEGLFGRGEARKKVWLMYSYGDNLEPYHDGKNLNPSKSVERVLSELAEIERLRLLRSENVKKNALEHRRKSG